MENSSAVNTMLNFLILCLILTVKMKDKIAIIINFIP